MEGETVLHVTEMPHSVQIARNASGGISFEVKVYSSDPEAAMERAKTIIAKLESDYPPARK